MIKLPVGLLKNNRTFYEQTIAQKLLKFIFLKYLNGICRISNAVQRLFVGFNLYLVFEPILSIERLLRQLSY